MSFMMLAVIILTSGATMAPVNVEENNDALTFTYHNVDKNSCTIVPLSPFPYERPTLFCPANTQESFTIHKSQLTKVDFELQSTVCPTIGHMKALEQELEDTAFGYFEWPWED